MNTLIVFFILLSSVSAFAAQEVRSLTCKFSFEVGEDRYAYNTRISTHSDGRVDADTSAVKTNLQSNKTTDIGGYQAIAQVQNFKIRAGLSLESETDGLNDGERAIVAAMDSEDMEKSSIKLQDVRAVTVYRLTNIADGHKVSSVVETKSAQGKSLGLFSGGLDDFVAIPCLK